MIATAPAAPDPTATLIGAFWEYPRISVVLDRLERLHRYGQNRFGSYEGMVIAGETRTGKTRLLEEYRDRCGSEAVREAGLVRRCQKVVLIEMPRVCSLKGVCLAILDHFGIRAKWRTHTVILANDALDCLRAAGCEMLILDEAHHMLSSDNVDHLAEVADFIKSILNQRICCAVLAGTLDLKNLCDSNRQLHERLPYKMLVRAYDWEVADERQEFRLLLDNFESQLPLEPIGLGRNRNFAYRIWKATQGRPGSGAALIKGATIHTMTLNLPHLTMGAFEKAYDDAHGFDESRQNPFALDGEDFNDSPAISTVDPDTLSGLRKGMGRTPHTKEIFRK